MMPLGGQGSGLGHHRRPSRRWPSSCPSSSWKGSRSAFCRLVQDGHLRLPLPSLVSPPWCLCVGPVDAGQDGKAVMGRGERLQTLLAWYQDAIGKLLRRRRLVVLLVGGALSSACSSSPDRYEFMPAMDVSAIVSVELPGVAGGDGGYCPTHRGLCLPDREVRTPHVVGGRVDGHRRRENHRQLIWFTIKERQRTSVQ